MGQFYESERAVAEYLLFHFGDDNLVLPWAEGPRSALGFPARCVSECLLKEIVPASARALDLGCAVGRSALELSRHCQEVVAIDSSQAFIIAARRLCERGRLDFAITREGGLSERATARTPPGTHPERIRFEVADALNLPPNLGDFDVILAANLIDRVPFPRRLVTSFNSLVTPGGQLILTSPYTWLNEYTSPEEWLCAEDQPTHTVLAGLLPSFSLRRRVDLPFLIREHARKFQWSVAEATVWVRR